MSIVQTGESVSDVGGERNVVTLTVLGLKHPAGHHLQVLDVGDDGGQLLNDTPRPFTYIRTLIGVENNKETKRAHPPSI